MTSTLFLTAVTLMLCRYIQAQVMARSIRRRRARFGTPSDLLLVVGQPTGSQNKTTHPADRRASKRRV